MYYICTMHVLRMYTYNVCQLFGSGSLGPLYANYSGLGPWVPRSSVPGSRGPLNIASPIRLGSKSSGNVNSLVCLLIKTLQIHHQVQKMRRRQQLLKVFQIHHWVQKVRRRQQLLKVFICYSISIIGTPEQQL